MRACSVFSIATLAGKPTDDRRGAAASGPAATLLTLGVCGASGSAQAGVRKWECASGSAQAGRPPHRSRLVRAALQKRIGVWPKVSQPAVCAVWTSLLPWACVHGGPGPYRGWECVWSGVRGAREAGDERSCAQGRSRAKSSSTWSGTAQRHAHDAGLAPMQRANAMPMAAQCAWGAKRGATRQRPFPDFQGFGESRHEASGLELAMVRTFLPKYSEYQRRESASGA